MTRPTKHTLARRQNLRRGSAQQLVPVPTATVEQVATVDLSSSSSEASEDEDEDIGEEVLEEVLDFDVDNFGNDNNTKNLFQKLFEVTQTQHNEKKRVLQYSGNSVRHQQRKRAENAAAAKGT